MLKTSVSNPFRIISMVLGIKVCRTRLCPTLCHGAQTRMQIHYAIIIKQRATRHPLSAEQLLADPASHGSNSPGTSRSKGYLIVNNLVSHLWLLVSLRRPGAVVTGSGRVSVGVWPALLSLFCLQSLLKGSCSWSEPLEGFLQLAAARVRTGPIGRDDLGSVPG